MLRILVASSINERPEILHCFLHSLSLLKLGKNEVSFYFIDDNEAPASKQLLLSFQASTPNTQVKSMSELLQTVSNSNQSNNNQSNNEQSNHRESAKRFVGVEYNWTDENIFRSAFAKNHFISYMLEHQFNTLFLVSSNILLHPDTLLNLIAADKEIISSIYWSKNENHHFQTPQVWISEKNASHNYIHLKQRTMEQISDEQLRFMCRLRTPGIYEVDSLDTCTLIRRSALLKGVSYHKLPNISYWDEYRHFCIRAAALDIPLYVDTHKPSFYMSQETDLANAQRFLKDIADGNSSHGIRISLCMIVKNEEKLLPRCLSSVSGVADEIIIVDTGSTDKTKVIALEYGAKVYDFAWSNDFAAARNYSFSLATEDYILWLDADDYISDKDRLMLFELKENLSPTVDSVIMNYHLGLNRNGEPTTTVKRHRIVKRSCGFKWKGAVHEYLDVFGEQIELEIAISHLINKGVSERILNIYRERLKMGEAFTPRDHYYFAKDLQEHAFYEEAVQQYELFLASKQGLVEDNFNACIGLADCYGHMYERDKQVLSLFRSMDYVGPRAEACCRLGVIYKSEENYRLAIYWFNCATKLGDPPSNEVYVERAYWTWLPYYELAICYEKLGDIPSAKQYIEQGLTFSPENQELQNKLRNYEGMLIKQL